MLKAGSLEDGARRHGLHYYIKGGLYGYVNFYIDQSRKYFPERNLRLFVNFYGMTLFYWCVGVLLLGPATVWLHYIIALLCAPVHAVFLALYSQHLAVIVHTLRYVLVQPAVPDHTLTTPNKRIVLTREEFVKLYPEAFAMGLGLVEERSGKVHFQVLQRSAVNRMKLVIFLSVAGLFDSALLTTLSVGLGICGLAGLSSYCRFMQFH